MFHTRASLPSSFARTLPKRGLAAVAAIAATVLASAALAQTLPDAYPLPGEAVFPEGIALDPEAGRFYVGATNGGTLYRADIASGEVEVFAEGTQPTAIGMEVDPYGRLWVAGGPSGNVYVYDTASGDLLRSYETPASDGTFLNDLAFARDAVYVTDSQRPVLFRIGAGETLGELDAFVSFEGTPFAYVDGFNANGVVVAPGGWSLVIVSSATGELYRVGLGDGAVSRVASSAEPVTAGDGLVLDGSTLYVVRNQLGQIDRLTLSSSGRAVAPAGEPIRSEAFHFPTTAAVLDGSLFVVNSQFDRQGGTPDLPFEVVRIDLP
jgi:Cu-Zn family superoxide dismutase